jgi:hypothetical protein
MSRGHAVLLVLVAGFSTGIHAAATASCESPGDQSACVTSTENHEPLLAQLVPGRDAGAPVPKQAARPLEPLCRDYRELTERRAMVDRQQMALLPKFQMLEEVCLTEGRPPTLSNYACTLPSRKFVRGSCCVGPWDCLNSSQASCDSMESLCKGLGAAWSKE